MVQLDMKVENGRTSISFDSLEHIMACLANQKFVGEPPQNGDSLAEGKEKYDKVQKECQDAIDGCWKQGMDFMSKRPENKVE